LVLQMQKDCLHIEWPFGPKVNHTLVPCHSEDAQEVWVMSRLQLEPISMHTLTVWEVIPHSFEVSSS
jgi:hypothetical protein